MFSIKKITTVNSLENKYVFNNNNNKNEGELDTTFGTDGIVTTDLNNNSNDVGKSLQIDENYIYMGGYSDNNFAIVKYTKNDGTLDTTFGTNGIVITDLNSSNDVGNSLQIYQNYIYLGGYSGEINNKDFAIVRYNKDNGTLDTTFGTNGIVITDLNNNSNDVGNSLQIDNSGIYLSGYTNEKLNSNDVPHYIAIVKYKFDGSLDTNFGTTGKVVDSDQVVATSLQLDDTYIYLGAYTTSARNTTTVGAIRNIEIYKYDKYTGNLVSNFGTNGRITDGYNLTSTDFLSSMQLYEDYIYVTGYEATKPIAFKYNKNDGTPDPHFGNNNGKFIVDDIIGRFNSVLVNKNHMYLGGWVNGDSNTYEFIVIRYNKDGMIDTSFGNDGIAITNISSGNDIGYSLQIDDKNIYMAGTINNIMDGTSNNNFAVVRYDIKDVKHIQRKTVSIKFKGV